jgi:hypothetical protein
MVLAARLQNRSRYPQLSPSSAVRYIRRRYVHETHMLCYPIRIIHVRAEAAERKISAVDPGVCVTNNGIMSFSIIIVIDVRIRVHGEGGVTVRSNNIIFVGCVRSAFE